MNILPVAVTVTTVLSYIPVKKNLIMCPRCLAEGKRQILGEIDEKGRFIVLRFHTGSTVFESNNFTVRCACGEVVYQKTAEMGAAHVF